MTYMKKAKKKKKEKKTPPQNCAQVRKSCDKMRQRCGIGCLMVKILVKKIFSLKMTFLCGGGGGGGGKNLVFSVLYLYAEQFAARFTTILSLRGSRDRAASHLANLYQ